MSRPSSLHPNVLRLTCGTPFPTGVLEVSDEFLLLRIDRDHRFARGQRRDHGVVDVNELRIAIGMAVAFPGLAIGLQAELLLVQQTRRPPCGRPGGLSPPKPPPTATGFCKSSAAATSDRRAHSDRPAPASRPGVAVGTPIAGRPRTDPDRPDLGIRLLPRVFDVKAHVGPCRTRSSAWVTRTRLCVRCVLC